MESLKGRDADVITTPSGNRLIVHFFTGILEHFPEIDSFQVEQSASDHLIIRIVPTRAFRHDDMDRVKFALVDKGLRDMTVKFELVEDIPLPLSGKHRFIINTSGKT